MPIAPSPLRRRPCEEAQAIEKKSSAAESCRQLQWDGWAKLPDGMPEWDIRSLVEKLHGRYHQRILSLLEQHRADWQKGDDEDSAPGASRPGGLVARLVSEQLKDSGVFVYAAHPSQAEDAESEYDYTGPRWYVTCMEAAMKHYGLQGVAPPPPDCLQALLWPCKEDRRRPWLTELGWTVVPENSNPQVMHADICSSEAAHARKPGRGRYHHFVWKLDPKDVCTTNIVPGAFTEGCPEDEHYNKWTIARERALIFDSEMLHRGGQTRPGVGWSSTLTCQLCSGTGMPALRERVSTSLMWYTQPIGWQKGDAVDALLDGRWQPALVVSRSPSGSYKVIVKGEDSIRATILTDSDLRYRQASQDGANIGSHTCFQVGTRVDALFAGKWYAARISRCNADNSYRVIWLGAERSFTDGLLSDQLQMRAIKRSSSGVAAGSKGAKRAKKATTCTDSLSQACASTGDAIRHQVFSQAFAELEGGLPESWRNWDVFNFVEAYYDRFNEIIMRELTLLRDFWTPCENSGQRFGAFAAAKITARLERYGIAVYSPGDSQQEEPPYRVTGPRWYVSVTQAALDHYDGGMAPPLAADMRQAICGHPADQGKEVLRLRGLGWTLAPAGSDPQALHADIWGFGKHARTDRTRWPHLLWKRDASQCCTTQLVPGAFTEGAASEEHFKMIKQARAPAILVDSEALHRGGPTPPATDAQYGGWMSTLSMEFCTPSGWAAWEEYSTGGTAKDPTSSADWRMLSVANEDGLPVKLAAAAPPVADLPAAPWRTKKGKDKLREEQRKWEFST